MKATDLDALDYLQSLALTEQPTEVRGMDGGALWRIADEHFVMLVCKQDHGPGRVHRGPELLRRVIPPHWSVFYSAVNPALEFEAHHWGPADAV